MNMASVNAALESGGGVPTADVVALFGESVESPPVTEIVPERKVDLA